MRRLASGVAGRVRASAWPVILFGVGCSEPARAPAAPLVLSARAPAPPAPVANAAPVDPVEAAWDAQLVAAHPKLRARARALLELCSVEQDLPTEEPDEPSLSCDEDTFGQPREQHTFRATKDVKARLLDTGVEVNGSFLEPGADERLVMFAGDSNGSTGFTSGFLLRREADHWATQRTFTGFPATSCVALPRPGRTALIFCGFQNGWQGQTAVWAALFDASKALQEDPLNAAGPSPTRGHLAPLQEVMTTGHDEAVEKLHRCPDPYFLRPLDLLPPAPIHVAAKDGAVTLTVRLHDVTVKAARTALCREEPQEPVWPTRDVTYALALRGERLHPTGPHAAQDAELRRLLLVPPR